MKKICKLTVVLLISVLLATVLMLLVYLLPTQNMQKHIKESVQVMEQEGDYHETLPGVISSRLDNFTDSIMLLSSAHKEQTNLIDCSMNVYRVRYTDKTPSETLVSYGMGEKGYTVSPYSRYWHGYQLILKPLLLFFNYQEIRYINMFAQTLLIMAIVVAMGKRKLNRFIFPYLIMLFSLMPVSIGLSLQFSSVYYITNIATLILLCRLEKLEEKDTIIFFFLSIGMLTSFMDFLTYPLVTLGIPLAVYSLLTKKQHFLENVFDIIKYSIIWAVGYIGMWAGKWIMGSILLRRNIITDAIEALLNRTSSETDEVNFTHLSVIQRNAEAMFSKPMKLLFLGTLAVLVVILLCKGIQNKKNYFKNYHYLVIACMPIAWYVVTGNHSYMHFWFTYRELAIFIFAVLIWGFVNVEDCLCEKCA